MGGSLYSAGVPGGPHLGWGCSSEGEVLECWEGGKEYALGRRHPGLLSRAGPVSESKGRGGLPPGWGRRQPQLWVAGPLVGGVALTSA